MKYVVLDTETTDKVGDVIQMALIVLDDNFRIERFDSFYCNTDKLVSEGAYKVHNISNEMACELSEGKYLEDYILGNPYYKKLFFEPGVVFVGFNVGFDLRTINRNLTEQTGLGFATPLNCRSILNLDESKRYSLDLMQHYRKKLNMVKGLNLSKTVELVVKDLDVDSFYKQVANHYGLKAGHTFHDAAYDTYCTMLLLFEYGKDVC